MKIRLGLLDNNQKYVSKILAYFNRHHSEELEVYVFSSYEAFSQFIKNKQIDVLLAEPELVTQGTAFPKSISVGYLAESADIETIYGVEAVCRYQKADLIYKEIVNLYAELDKKFTYKSGKQNTHMLAFFGASGGVGTTTAAVCCAEALAIAGKSVLYLNLEQNGVTDSYLTGEGTMTLTDVLYAVKSKYIETGDADAVKARKANLSLKFSSIVRQDESGVYFFEPFAVLLDALSLKKEDILEIIKVLTESGIYEHIVLDLGSYLDGWRKELLGEAERIFLVSSGTEISNSKLLRLVNAIEIEDSQKDTRVLSNVSIFYNRFGSDSADAVCAQDIPVFARIQNFKGGSTDEIMREIASAGSFRELL